MLGWALSEERRKLILNVKQDNSDLLNMLKSQIRPARHRTK